MNNNEGRAQRGLAAEDARSAPQAAYPANAEHLTGEKEMSLREMVMIKANHIARILGDTDIHVIDMQEILWIVETFGELAAHNYAIMGLQDDFLKQIGRNDEATEYIKEHFDEEIRKVWPEEPAEEPKNQ